MHSLYFYLMICCVILQEYGFTAHIHSHHGHGDKERVEHGGSHYHNHENEDYHSFNHEVVLGSSKEADEFDNLTEEQAKEKLAELVKKMDLNKNGFIEPDELYKWIVQSLKKLSLEETKDLFEEKDENKDGRVSWDEEIRGILKEQQENGNELDDNENEIILEDKRTFIAADTNKDGALDQDEYEQYIHPEEYPNMLPVIIENTLADKDTNKDGVIDFNEFISGSGKINDEEWLLTEKTKFSEEYDKNRDGVLFNSEILNWVTSNNTRIAIEETRYLFASTDDDHDEQLSLEEILSNYRTFIESEATDYGDLLTQSDPIRDEL